MVAHCLFEQSGTFKNEFKKLGIEAYDYDIQNEFNETDYVVDLFEEIRGGGMRVRKAYLINSVQMILYLPFSLAHALKQKYLYCFVEKRINKRNGHLMIS